MLLQWDRQVAISRGVSFCHRNIKEEELASNTCLATERCLRARGDDCLRVLSGVPVVEVEVVI